MKIMRKRIISLFLAILMLLPVIPMGTISASAATNHTQAEAVEWIKARGNENWWQDVDSSYDCQCVDLIMAYYEYLVGYRVSGNAKDYLQSSKLPSGWWMDSTPSAGAIIVWDGNTWTGQWTTDESGHVGLVYSVSGSNVYTVETNTGSTNGQGDAAAAKFRTRVNCNAKYIHPNFSASSEHTHNKGELVYYWKEHPHYNCYKCSICGVVWHDTSETNSVPDSCSTCAKASHTHSYTSSVTKNPDCTIAGQRTYTCSCGDTYTEAISATGHTPVTDNMVLPTCTKQGLSEGSHCSKCNSVIKEQTVIPALGHDYKLTSYSRTCDDVTGAYKCSKCGDRYEETDEYIWSDWSEKEPEDVSSDLIEEKTLYRYSLKETTQSDKNSLDGWTKYKSEITDWTNWSAWQNSSITATDSREVKTQYIKPTYKTVWHYSRDTGGGYSTYAIGYYGNPEYITLNYRLTAKGTVDGYTRYGSYGNYLADYWWNESSESVVDKAGYTQYSYRDAIYTHYYYKWSDMSDWQETPVEENDNTNVETSTVYRYKIMPLENENEEPTLDFISIHSKPTKTVYTVGETFSSSGLSINVNMSDGTSKTVTSGFTVSSPDMSTAGTKTVTVTYEGKTTTFTITVNNPPATVSSIAVQTMPLKTVYTVGETFSSSGFSIKVNMSDGTSKTVTSGFTVSSPDMSTAGTKTVTVTYEGKTAIFNITVKAVSVTPNPTEYDVTVTLEAPSKLAVGKEFTLNVYLEGSYDGYSFEIPKYTGFTYKSSTPYNNSIKVDEKSDRLVVSTMPGLELKNSPKTLIVSVTYTVNQNAAVGNMNLTVENAKITNELGDKITAVFIDEMNVEIVKRIPGDINGDDVFDYTDVAKLYAYFRGKTTIDNDINIDFNNDGTFDYTDVAKLYAIFRGNSAF